MTSTVASATISPTMKQIESCSPSETTNTLRLAIYASVIKHMKEIWERINKIQESRDAEVRQKQLAELIKDHETQISIHNAKTYCAYFSALAPSIDTKFNYLKLNVLEFCHQHTDCVEKATLEEVYKTDNFSSLYTIKESLFSKMPRDVQYEESTTVINALFNAFQISFEVHNAFTQ